jgi:hypothetical protein
MPSGKKNEIEKKKNPCMQVVRPKMTSILNVHLLEHHGNHGILHEELSEPNMCTLAV